jgi:hypothetical protein
MLRLAYLNRRKSRVMLGVTFYSQETLDLSDIVKALSRFKSNERRAAINNGYCKQLHRHDETNLVSSGGPRGDCARWCLYDTIPFRESKQKLL